MKHPDPDAIRAAMERLEATVADYDSPVLDMAQGGMTTDPICGTVACHGGWYAIAACDFQWSNDGQARRFGALFTYRDGAEQLARDLGFRDRFDLMVWAGKSPTVWGNPHGMEMFRRSRAFGVEPATLPDVIAHWRGVAGRIEEKKDAG